jgi:hypothetical protein
MQRLLTEGRDFVERLKQRSKQHISITPEKTIIYGEEKDLIYVPSNTGLAFHQDDSFVCGVFGPFGSGKTTMCLQRVVEHACSMPYWSNGRRRARWAFVRNTSGELYSTTLQSWITWFGELGDVKKRQKPLLTYEHHFNDGKGVVELEIIFIALDRPEDVRKIKSLELTGVYLNEMSELPEAVLSNFKGRVNGRYPSKSFCNEAHWTGILFDTNPPDEDHYIYRIFEKEKVENHKIYYQPSGLIDLPDGTYTQNQQADNANNLASDYYVKLAQGQREGFINVYCRGKYGLVENGKRVYPEYNDDIHSIENIAAIQGDPIHLAWDFGLTPSCVVFQVSARGQFRVLKEYVSKDMGIKTFAQSVVIPGLQRDFPYCKVGESEADPAGNAADAIMEELSCIGELNNLGIKTNAAYTNDPNIRIGAVRFFLNIMIDGQPGFILSRTGCPVVRKGFMSGYHFKRVNVANDDRYQDKPNKNQFSQPHDALQYGALKFASRSIIDNKVEDKKVDMFNPVMRIF